MGLDIEFGIRLGRIWGCDAMHKIGTEIEVKAGNGARHRVGYKAGVDMGM